MEQYVENEEVELSEDDFAQKELMREKFEQFSAVMSAKRDDWVQARRSMGIEKRWSEDLDHYHGRDIGSRSRGVAEEVAYAIQNRGKKPSGTTRSKVFVNVTRQKTNAAEARLADLVLPTDDKNWGIKPTPIPSLIAQIGSKEPLTDPMGNPHMGKQLDQEGKPRLGPDGKPVIAPLTVGDTVNLDMIKARKAAEMMEREIDDQLNECSYNGEVRRIIHDAAVLGVGVIEGPIITNRTRKSWNKVSDGAQTAHIMELIEDFRPGSKAVSPWDFFPDPACGERIHDGEGVFKRDRLTYRRVRELMKLPGYIEDEVEAVLEEGPKGNDRDAYRRGDEDDLNLQAQSGKLFEVWFYYGDIRKEEMESCGCEVSDDMPKTIPVVVTMINDRVVKVHQNPMDDGCFPFDTFVWERVDNMWAGYGVPRLMQYAQRIINAATRQMMDNASRAAGPQTVVKRNKIVPADGSYEMTPHKFWYATDELDKVSDAFAQFETNMHQREFQEIIFMGLRFADEETGVPNIMQGQQVDPKISPQTVGGMQMLMNAGNTVLRRLVKQFDDMITRPHLTRYYEWNMLYNEKDDIKGDYEVDARGSSTLIERDAVQQSMVELMQLSQSPVGSMIKWDEWLRETMKMKRLPADAILKTKDELDREREQAAQNPQPQDPRIAAAEIRAKSEAESRQIQGQIQQQEMAFEADQRERDRQLDQYVAQIEKEIQMMELAGEQKISLEKIKAMLSDTALKERNKRDLFAAEQNLKVKMGSGI